MSVLPQYQSTLCSESKPATGRNAGKRREVKTTMSAPNFVGDMTLDVVVVRQTRKFEERTINLASGLNLFEFTKLVGCLDKGLTISVTTKIWPHEDSGADLASWTVRGKVSDFVR